MSILRVLCLAVAIALGSLVFTADAGATVLCHQNEEVSCQEPFAPTKLKLSATSPLLTGPAEVTCTSSAATLETTSEGGEAEAVTGKVTSLSFTGCKSPTFFGIGCTVTAQSLPYAASLSYTSSPDGSLTFSSGGTGTPGFHAVCGPFVSCTFSGSTTMTFLGGSPAHVLVNEVELTPIGGGGLCPEEAFWDANYALTEPNGGEMFVAPRPVTLTLCKGKKLEVPCVTPYPNGEIVEGFVAPAGFFELQLNGLPKISCSAGTFKAEVLETTRTPPSLPFRQLAFEMTGCTTPVKKCTNLVANNLPKAGNMPASLKNGNGDMFAAVEYTIECEGQPPKCTYQNVGSFALEGGELPKIGANGPLQAQRAGMGCPATGNIFMEIPVATPSPEISGLFVTKG